MLRTIGDGLQYVAKDTALSSLLMVIAVLNFAITGPTSIGIAVIAKREFGSAAAFGLLASALAAADCWAPCSPVCRSNAIEASPAARGERRDRHVRGNVRPAASVRGIGRRAVPDEHSGGFPECAVDRLVPAAGRSGDDRPRDESRDVLRHRTDAVLAGAGRHRRAGGASRACSLSPVAWSCW